VLADEASEGDTKSFDMPVLRLFRNPADMGQPIGPGWLQEAVRDITSLGRLRSWNIELPKGSIVGVACSLFHEDGAKTVEQRYDIAVAEPICTAAQRKVPIARMQ
jgi:hypothetical protein